MFLIKNKIATILSVITISIFSFQWSMGQEFNLINKESSLMVLGTSSLHDWHITAESHKGSITFKDLMECGIDKCNVEVTVESLKSGKKSMDKNTYKALNSNEFDKITFQLSEVKEVMKKSAGKFIVKSTGDLKIMNVKKRIPIELQIDITKDKIVVSGVKKIKMTDFNVEPPKALFGTITTGDDITIKFESIFK